MKRNDIILIIVVVLLVVAVVQIKSMDSSRKRLEKLYEIEKKESEKKVESVIDKMKKDSISYTKELQFYKNRIDSLKKRHYESLKAVVKAQGNLDAYRNASDSIRFSKFKELLAEVD